ncbi:Multidrug resistance protein MdtA [bioreactor metagenome]|uniref:Multidrug resistance protein MdtA n=1 Tax=bioreactor metagenome TaxID=1076179 RepID=A0A644WW08_9ZZZZ
MNLLSKTKVKLTTPQFQAEGKKKSVKKWLIITGTVIAVAVAALSLRGLAGRKAGTESEYTFVAAGRRDITDTLAGSGALEPADSYTVTTLISGDILTAGFEEGDIVKKGDVLYQLDSSDAATGIARSELSVSKSQRAYQDKADSLADLTVKAPISGTITGMTVKTGDTVGTQIAIASIKNTSTLSVTEYYSDEYAGLIYAGMQAMVSVPGQMLNLTGQVSEVSAQKRVSDTGVPCFAVTVQVTNPGALTAGMDATGWLVGSDTIYPTIEDGDGLDALGATTVYAKVQGTVSKISVRNGETVSAGQTILLLESDTLADEVKNAADSLKDAQLSLQSQYDTLDNYTITAPIDGTIIDKYYKQGETSETNKPLCIIYDLSYLTLTLDVDELDIAQISVGQKAAVTADAVPDSTYEGTITKIGINGTTTGGVTTYPVTIRIDETKGLLPGMNVDVSIVVKESKNALSIPAGAIEHSGRVLVKTADGTTGEGAPDGYGYVEVKTGASDGDYVEILSGLAEGDTVAYIPETAQGGSLLPFTPGGEGSPAANMRDAANGQSTGGNTP